MTNKEYKPYIIVCDIDNVFMDSREWEMDFPKQADLNDRVVWDEFHKKCYKVKPNPSIVKTLACINDLIPIFFVTAREDRYNMREVTARQIEDFSEGLIKIDYNYNRLYMRPENDFGTSYAVKEKIILDEILPHYNIAIAIDDDIHNIEMYKKYNIPTKFYDKYRKK